MVQVTRKSNRQRFITSKAKQLQENQMSSQLNTSSHSKKPILRSITTIDDNENTYNNLNFKRRKLQPIVKSEIKQEDELASYESSDDEEFSPFFKLRKDLLMEQNSDADDLLGLSDEENFFNSDDDNEYYSAISDYESDNLVSKVSQKRFINHSKAFDQFKRIQDEKKSRLSHHESKYLQDVGNSLFDSEDDENESNIESPVNSNFNFNLVDGDLKSLEENFQKIIDENHNKSTESKTTTPNDESSSIINTISSSTSIEQPSNIDDFVDYSSEVVSSDEDSEQSEQQLLKKSSKLLHYRHDERHNLAFLDVSTFPIRYDPTTAKTTGNKKFIRALNKRAILSGKASEMVGTGMSIGEFNIFI